VSFYEVATGAIWGYHSFKGLRDF